jgi:uncharacterized protein (DUF1778 family)
VSDELDRALEGESLTEDEQRRLWAESPVIRVSAQSFEELVEALDREPRELPRLLDLLRETPPWDKP